MHARASSSCAGMHACACIVESPSAEGLLNFSNTGDVSRAEKMALRETDLESSITEYASVNEDNRGLGRNR